MLLCPKPCLSQTVPGRAQNGTQPDCPEPCPEVLSIIVIGGTRHGLGHGLRVSRTVLSPKARFGTRTGCPKPCPATVIGLGVGLVTYYTTVQETHPYSHNSPPVRRGTSRRPVSPAPVTSNGSTMKIRNDTISDQVMVTTTLPKVTITLPMVTTTLPKVTTTLPKVTTTLPKVTTTLPK
ncbi:hypothetical protein Bbelb_084910 [Branchiostoma belcheri]|nr:hypothetical protein Bbelb_084910 [Branchiostoma belcheri]